MFHTLFLSNEFISDIRGHGYIVIIFERREMREKRDIISVGENQLFEGKDILLDLFAVLRRRLARGALLFICYVNVAIIGRRNE